MKHLVLLILLLLISMAVMGQAAQRSGAATSAYNFDFTTSGGDIRTASGISTWKEAAAGGGGARQRCVGCGSDLKVIE